MGKVSNINRCFLKILPLLIFLQSQNAFILEPYCLICKQKMMFEKQSLVIELLYEKQSFQTASRVAKITRIT